MGQRPPSEEPLWIHGPTCLHVHCLQVAGGAEVVVRRLASNEILLRFEVTAGLAEQLSMLVGEVILLEGTATWDATSWDVVGFEATGLRETRW